MCDSLLPINFVLIADTNSLWTKDFFCGSTDIVGLGHLIVEVSRLHLDTALGITPLDKWSARRVDL